MSALRTAVALALLAAVAAAPLLAPWTKVILTVALAKGLAVLGIVVLLRAGQVSFGHGMFFAAAAYAAAFLARTAGGADLVPMLLLGPAASLALGLAVGLFVVRYRYIFFGMLNLAFSMVLYSMLEKSFHLTGGSDGMRVPRPTLLGWALERDAFEWTIFYATLALAALAAWLVHAYLRSPAGEALRAIKGNETRLEYLGVSARRVLLAAYLVSAFLAGLGGTLFAVVTGHVTPHLSFWVASGELVFIAILGGAGSVVGPFLGALAYELVRSYSSAFAGNAWQAILGVTLLVIILFAPRGLVGFLDLVGPRARRAEGGRPAGWRGEPAPSRGGKAT